ncbi:RNA 2',3'-cyclic phosphodiesterase [Emcibacter sp. SYSU 3D8]|uniref:RNA 2',3'-cyclic phosphodiesterase n=1 Tax=Emcibacter sp. SYSU 3D8 TaxID=3133969 RepID=UPI0031FF4666
MLRLFVALPLPPEVRSRLIGLMGGVNGARWQTDDQLHLTLRFIGEVDEARAEDIDSALRAINFAPFQVSLQGTGLFGDIRKPRMLWAGVGPEAPLAHLAQKIDTAMVRIGLPAEQRKFMPHVTLARFKGPSGRVDRFLAAHDQLWSQPWNVARFTLFRSHLAHSGAIYEALATYPDEDGDEDSGEAQVALLNRARGIR